MLAPRFAAAALLCLALPACNPATMGTESLCGRYSSPLSTQRGDPAVRAELIRRGAHSCVDPQNAAARGRNALVTGLLGPIAGAVDSAANPLPPIEGTAEHRAAVDQEIAAVRRSQAEAQRRQVIADMAAQGASDDAIRQALTASPR